MKSKHVRRSTNAYTNMTNVKQNKFSHTSSKTNNVYLKLETESLLCKSSSLHSYFTCLFIICMYTKFAATNVISYGNAWDRRSSNII